MTVTNDRRYQPACKQIFNSKKFLVANWTVFIAIVVHKLGLPNEIQIMLVSVFIAIVGIQGTIDVRRTKKPEAE